MHDKNGNYVIDQEKKEQLQALTLLNLMINQGMRFSVLLDGDNEDLEPLFRKLAAKDYVDTDKSNYIPSEKGRKALQGFLGRDTELILIFEIFCAVNMDEGTFAYSELFEMSEPRFAKYLQNEDEEWEDLRLMVLEFKNENQKNESNQIDPIDLVFADFIKNGRVDFTKPGWQFDLLSNLMWEEMLKIINDAYDLEELREEIEKDDEADWTAEELLETIVKQGNEVMRDNLEEEQRRKEEAEEEDDSVDNFDDDDDEIYEEVIIVKHEISYYDSYYDPFYISPILYVSIWDDPYCY